MLFSVGFVPRGLPWTVDRGKVSAFLEHLPEPKIRAQVSDKYGDDVLAICDFLGEKQRLEKEKFQDYLNACTLAFYDVN